MSDRTPDAEEVGTPHQMLKRGGEWLAAARSWLQWNTINGDSVTWGSDEFVKGNLSVRQFEELAATVALSVHKSHLLTIDELKKELSEIRAIFPQICEAIGNGSACSSESSVEFLKWVPKEVRLHFQSLRQTIAGLEERIHRLTNSHTDAHAALDETEVEKRDITLAERVDLLHAELRKTRKHLRDSNRGAERNAHINLSLVKRISTLEQERDGLRDKLWKQVERGDELQEDLQCYIYANHHMKLALNKVSNWLVENTDIVEENPLLNEVLTALKLASGDGKIQYQSHLSAMRQIIQVILRREESKLSSDSNSANLDDIKLLRSVLNGTYVDPEKEAMRQALERVRDFGAKSCDAAAEKSLQNEDQHAAGCFICKALTQSPPVEEKDSATEVPDSEISSHAARVKLLQRTIRVFDQFRAACPMEDLAEEFNRRMAIFRSELQARKSIDSAIMSEKGER